ncbi:phosphodiesterase [Minwuia sp.]|uniref:phosphodiesterase n=1 Tax=Minwuia sp. TaxID=2493630 RepID=UPI003A93F3D0
MKIVAITDTHIVPRGQTSRGLDTGERLTMALDDLAANHADAAFCVILGDLADHGEIDAYRHFIERIDGFPIPVHLMIGNHDNRANFRRMFPDTPVDANGFVQSVAVTEAGHFIFCDTHQPYHVDGRLCRDRLDWLDARLAEAAGSDAFLFLHHPPYRTGGPIDALRLTNHAELAETLTGHDNVRHIFAGHTHRMSTGVWHGMPFATLGATHYNNGLPLIPRGVHLPRFLTPGYTSVILIDAEQVVVHGNAFLHNDVALDPAQFDLAKIEALINAGGDMRRAFGNPAD